MKFTDGNWLIQPGATPHYPVEAYDVSQADGRLTITAPTRPIRHRGDTLQGPVLTVRIDTPMDDVIRVRIDHFTGGVSRGPRTPLQPVVDAPDREIAVGEKAATLRAGKLTARVGRGGGWSLAFEAEGRTITRSCPRGIGYVQWADRGAFMHEGLALGVGEFAYGFGERFTAFTKNGQVIENWNKDGGTSSDQAYKSVPFYLTNRGYGVLVNELGPVSFEVASEKLARVQFSVPGESLEYFVIYGPTPKDVLRKLTALTGRPALPPAWSFGLWLTTSFTTNYDEPTVTSFIDGMKQRDLPLHVFHFDCFWMREFEWCNLQWDPRTFPDPAGLLARLHQRGLKVCVWINPYIAQRSPLFEEARGGGFLLKRADGSVWQTDQWQPGMGIVDFTNPDACAWYTGHLRALLKTGVDAFKTDFGERIPTDVVYYDGSDPVQMHNHYSVLYNQVVFRLLEQERGRGDAVVFARSSTTSGQQFPVHWGGDCDSTFESMAESLRGGLSLGLSGFGFWSHDIGGFEGLPPAALYKRWIAFGLLSSHSRLHGSSTYRVPWNYDDEACDVLRFFTKLKCRLMPYLYAKAIEAAQTGLPVMRAMVLEFPDDATCVHVDRQYMLGDALLVAPIFSADGWVDYYLPAGRWTHLLTGDVREGPRWHREEFGYLSLPLFVRAGAILALGAVEDRPDYDYTRDVTFRVYEPADHATVSCELPTMQGRVAGTFRITRDGRRIEAQLEGATDATWQWQLAGTAAAKDVVGGDVRKDAAGLILRSAAGSRTMSCMVG
jgi:alpha-D-xyloside xylohydrolase